MFKYSWVIFPLDVRFNLIKDLESVRVGVTQLPQLEQLILIGNPVETVLDFRVKVLQMFGRHKCSECFSRKSVITNVLIIYQVTELAKSV